MIQLLRLSPYRVATALIVRCDHCNQRIHAPARGYALFHRDQPDALFHFLHTRCMLAFAAHHGGYDVWKKRPLDQLGLDLFQPTQARAIAIADFLIKREQVYGHPRAS